MNFDGTTSETKTTVHEFGHLYEAPDHYGGDTPTTVQIKLMTRDMRFDSNCIYGENKNNANVMGNLTICDGCKAIIQDNANKYS